jgi:hypothetical protein
MTKSIGPAARQHALDDQLDAAIGAVPIFEGEETMLAKLLLDRALALMIASKGPNAAAHHLATSSIEITRAASGIDKAVRETRELGLAADPAVRSQAATMSVFGAAVLALNRIGLANDEIRMAMHRYSADLAMKAGGWNLAVAELEVAISQIVRVGEAVLPDAGGGAVH